MELCPPLTIGLAFEKSSIGRHEQNNKQTINRSNELSAESLLDELIVSISHQQEDDELDQLTPSSPFSGGGGDPTVVKKLNHNASERHRRMKMNTLYSSLRSLLPTSDQMKKVSNPSTISRAVKYIPELQEQVKGLIERKEQLLSRICAGRQLAGGGDLLNKQGGVASAASVFKVVSWVNDTEVVLQICSYPPCALSEMVVDLEQDGLALLNASSFQSFEGKIFHNLHLQVQETT